MASFASTTTLEDLISFLRNPVSFAEGGPVELRETHISVVALTPTHAYKLCKPVDFGFLDFSTCESRHADGRRQILLNRRWSNGVYLDLLPIIEHDGQLKFGPPSDAENEINDENETCVDWVVRMRRLEERDTLEAHIDRGDCPADAIDRFFDAVEPTFRSAPVIEPAPSARLDERMRKAILGNIESLSHMAASEQIPIADVDQLRSAHCEFLAVHEPLFESRQEQGWVRDGHGDLRAEHIYLGDPLQVVDCVEFNSRLRQNDLLDEFCFLATDLERLGRQDLADRLIGKYRRQFRDGAPKELEAFYKSYRFAVRAKVTGLKAQEETSAINGETWENARQFIKLAIRAMEDVHRPSVIFFCGLSGSGKTTVARKLAQTLGAHHFSSDIVRKELFGVPPTTHSPEPEMYSSAANERTYAELNQRALCSICHQVTVVLDATYSRRHDRDRLRQMLEQCGIEYMCIECHCPRDIAENRIRERLRAGTDPSDADLAVLDEQVSHYEPPLEIPAGHFLSVETHYPLEEIVARIVGHLPM
ncbi:MAG: AAA family ATPase [Planctomycetota bacterium]|nr:AAA family ATPase [Planctomycetota bacterium]MDA1211333.1 AAA family ATPase [Planctomycetota bacterium]